MLRLLKILFLGHCHVWEEDDRHNLVESGKEHPIGIISYCHCTKCGARRSFSMLA